MSDKNNTKGIQEQFHDFIAQLDREKKKAEDAQRKCEDLEIQFKNIVSERDEALSQAQAASAEAEEAKKLRDSTYQGLIKDLFSQVAGNLNKQIIKQATSGIFISGVLVALSIYLTFLYSQSSTDTVIEEVQNSMNAMLELSNDMGLLSENLTILNRNLSSQMDNNYSLLLNSSELLTDVSTATDAINLLVTSSQEVTNSQIDRLSVVVTNLNEKTDQISRTTQLISEDLDNREEIEKSIVRLASYLSNNEDFGKRFSKFRSDRTSLELAFKMRITNQLLTDNLRVYREAFIRVGVEESIVPTENELHNWMVDLFYVEFSRSLFSYFTEELTYKNHLFAPFKRPEDTLDYGGWGRYLTIDEEMVPSNPPYSMSGIRRLFTILDEGTRPFNYPVNINITTSGVPNTSLSNTIYKENVQIDPVSGRDPRITSSNGRWQIPVNTLDFSLIDNGRKSQLVRSIQSKLGIFQDGRIGEETTTAISAYCISENLSCTNGISIELLQSLGINIITIL